MKRNIMLVSVGLAFIALGCAMKTEAADNTGALSLELMIADGVEIDEVEWEITNVGFLHVGTTDVSAPGSTASVEVFGLPADDGYLVVMEAVSVDSSVFCAGSAEFDVQVGVSNDVMVDLKCGLPEGLGGVRVIGDFNFCTELVRVEVSPLQTSVGNDINLSAFASDEDEDDITYFWDGGGGSIDDPSAQDTTYTCIDAGQHTITITVSDSNGEICADAWSVDVTCVAGVVVP
jgi:hypothetical protein